MLPRVAVMCPSHRRWLRVLCSVACLLVAARGVAAEPEAATPASTTGEADAECASLIDSGQIAAAMARGCPNAGQLPWAGSAISFSQQFAPFFGTLPDSDNPFYALGLTLLPRVQLSERVSLRGSWSLFYEATDPDSGEYVDQVVVGDSVLSVTYNTGERAAGLSYLLGPRLVLPTSREARQTGAVLGLGAQASVLRAFPRAAGLQLSASARYGYNASKRGQVTPRNRDDVVFPPGEDGQPDPDAPVLADAGEGVRIAGDVPRCQSGLGAGLPCPAGTLASSANEFAFTLSAALQLARQWNLQSGYTMRVRQPRDLPAVQVPAITADADTRVPFYDDRAWRRVGQFGLTVAYQPSAQLAITLGLTTTVCYSFESSVQSALGGCASGVRSHDFFERNPVLNRYSTLGLALNWFIDQSYLWLRKRRAAR